MRDMLTILFMGAAIGAALAMTIILASLPLAVAAVTAAVFIKSFFGIP